MHALFTLNAFLRRKSISLVIIFFLQLLCTRSSAQVATYYTFSQGTVGTNPASTSTANVIIGSWWDDDVANFNFPGGFTFNFNGTNYTNCYVNSNGYITFGNTAPSTTNYAPINSNAGYAGAFGAFADDLGDDSNAPITYNMTGTSPNRVLSIIWLKASRYNASANAFFSSEKGIYFAINLYETTNVIEAAYGNCTMVNYAENVQIGLRGTSNSDFNHRRLTTNSAWLNNTTTATGNGQGVNSKNNAKPSNLYTYFRWTPNCVPPVITSVTVNNPTTCGGTGSLVVNGTGLSGNYTVTYTSSLAGTVTTGSLTATGNTITISGLAAATYTNVSIKAAAASCSSNVLAGPYTISNPTAPSITSVTGTNPTTCGGSDGKLVITGASLSGNYTVTYTSSISGTVTTAAIAAVANIVTVTGLPAASYSNISIKSSTTLCASNVFAGPVVLTNPTAPSITSLSSTNPTTCGGSNGTITITGASLTGNYTVTYTSSLAGTVTTAAIAAVGNTVTITSLPAATYSNFSIKSAATLCNSNVLAGPVVLTDPATPVITSLTSTNPTTCSGSNGTITVNGSSLSGSYAVTYTSSIAGLVTTAAIAAVGNSVTVTGLPAATYSNFSIKSATTFCNSNTLAGPVVLIDPALPVITALSSTNTTTCSGSDGKLIVTGTALSGSYIVTYTSSVAGLVTTAAIASVANTVTVSGLPAANYSALHIQSASTLCNSNTFAGPVTIVDPAPPVIGGISSVNPSTCSGTDGSITLGGLNASTAYTLSYNNNPQPIVTDGFGNYTISNLPAGVYSNIYVVRFNCTSNTLGPVILTDPAPPVISNASPSGTTTCSGSDGSITVSGLLPVTAYTLSYNNTPQPIVTNAAGDFVINNLSAGTYSNVYVVRFNCTSNTISTVVVSDPVPPAITSTASAGPTSCFGSDGYLVLQGLLPLSNYNVSYSNGLTTFTPSIAADAAGNVTIPGLPAGTYSTINVTINNCTSGSVGPITISDPPTPVITASTNAPICEGQTLMLMSNVTLNGNPTIAQSYSWSGPAFVNPNTQANPTVPNAAAAATGTYTVTATIANCVSAPFMLPVTVYAAPAVPSFSANTPLCSGNDLHLDVAGADPSLIYIWTGPGLATPDTNTNAVLSNAQVADAGTYDLSVVNPYGCGLLLPSTVNVVINQTPSAPLPDDAIYCQGDIAVALTATPSGNPNDVLNWYTVPTGGTGTVTAPVPSTTSPGTFTWYVSQTSQPGCEGPRAPQSVYVKPKPAAPTTTSPSFTYCQFDSTAVALVATGDSLQWYTAPSGGIGSFTAPVPPTTTAGVTTWYVSQTREACESDRLAIAVTIVQKPQPPITEDLSYCQYDSSIALTATGDSLKWYSSPQGGVPLPATPIPSTASADTTTWYVSQTVNGCESDLAPLRVIVYYKPTAGIITSRDEVCQQDTLLITYVGNGSTTTTYSWTWPTGSVIENGTGQGPYVVRFNAIGTFDIGLVASENGCASPLATHRILVKQTPSVSIGLRNNIVCTDDPAYIEIRDVDMEIQTYAWDLGAAYTTNGSGAADGKGPYYLAWPQAGNYTVSLAVTAKDGCISKATDTIMVHERPEAKISGAVSEDICTGEDVELSASVNNSKYSYKWLPAQLFDYDYNSPVVKAHADKSAMVTLEVTNEYGCTSMDSVMLHTKPCCELYLPSAFSPNGDGKNDLFRILNPGRHKLESLKVYNRYGQEVFTTSNEADGWNGSYNGVAQEIGTYQYMVKYKCDGKDNYIKGEVTLVR